MKDCLGGARFVADGATRCPPQVDDTRRRELQVLSVEAAPKAKWRLARHAASARSRPLLTVRQALAEASSAKAALKAVTAHARARAAVKVAGNFFRKHKQDSSRVAKIAAGFAGAVRVAKIAADSIDATDETQAAAVLSSDDDEQTRVGVAASKEQSVNVEEHAKIKRARKRARDEAKKTKKEIRELKQKLAISETQAARISKERARSDSAVETERQRRVAAETEVANLKMQVDVLKIAVTSNKQLRQRISELERNYQQQQRQQTTTSRQPAPAATPTRAAMAKHIAELECAPLRGCAAEESPALKKKLLLKWHPDKQASPENAALATQVVQELQNRREWK